MNCADREEQIHAYLKGRLAPEQAREFERHLESCGECRREVAREKGLDSLLSAWVAPEPQVDFSTRLAGRVTQPAPVRASGLGFRLPAYSALAAVLVMAVVGVWQHWPQTMLQPEVEAAGQYEFFEKLDMLQHWEMLQHWDEIAAHKPLVGEIP